MPVRGSMASLIARTRLLINDTLPAGSGQVFLDTDIQNVLDESRLDLYNQPLVPQWTYSGSTPQVLDYFAPSQWGEDRKSTRLNSSHQIISYAVFCLKK